MTKYKCPYCNEVEVEQINACGASNYFCTKCKRLVPRDAIKSQKKQTSD